MEVSSQLHDLAALLPGKESPIPIGYEAVGMDRVAKRKKKKPDLTGIEYRSSNP
jgi:hypothetical protein